MGKCDHIIPILAILTGYLCVSFRNQFKCLTCKTFKVVNEYTPSFAGFNKPCTASDRQRRHFQRLPTQS